MKIKEISGFLFISILLCLGALGCKDEANKFEGKWYNKSNPETIITIYRSGNNFIYGASGSKWPPNYDSQSDKMIVTQSLERESVDIDVYYNLKDKSIITLGSEYLKVP